MKHELICIVCPEGCHLSAAKELGEWRVLGAKCPRGQVYGMEEVTTPKRVVTAVVQTDSDELPFVPVKSDKAIQKENIDNVLQQLSTLRLQRPLKRGQAVLTNVDQEQTNIVLTRTLW